jgi:hypothetical protein
LVFPGQLVAEAASGRGKGTEAQILDQENSVIRELRELREREAFVQFA